MSENQPHRGIVIVGAGIIGLDVALLLCEKGFGPCITIIAEYMPGDTSPSYCSPWAGCNFSAISGTDANALKWDREGYKYLRELWAKHGKDAYVQRTPSVEFWDEQIPSDKIKFMSEYLEDFKILPTSELLAGTSFGISFSTYTINAPKHIAYLAGRLRNQYGVTFLRKTLPDIFSAYGPSTRLVFNCTGAAARTLKGVEDGLCYPTRGQVLLARAPAVKKNMMRHGKDFETYIIPRPGTDGHVVLGGYMQKMNSDPATYVTETASILERTKALNPSGLDSTANPAAGVEVLAALTGARPSREGGARIAREELLMGDGEENKREVTLVHNYGAGGTGFQAGRGMAVEAVALVEGDVLKGLAKPTAVAKL
ncbi:FAD dependent oxidoreductase [Microdochium trichocladiopsis]|uniref:FAD dependent oxidoreductase n=1 Tax=Microdochium trichocladiopsis TaxID=1682393 RepID=A0A9P8XX34_9PEZI|nr:FAD dependent oxidoreductase [Microdochium trichocladiopsis]KAH7024407.1 FAD dependent oxidoreductase [Microdochium trichocladiopsis]